MSEETKSPLLNKTPPLLSEGHRKLFGGYFALQGIIGFLWILIDDNSAPGAAWSAFGYLFASALPAAALLTDSSTGVFLAIVRLFMEWVLLLPDSERKEALSYHWLYPLDLLFIFIIGGLLARDLFKAGFGPWAQSRAYWPTVWRQYKKNTLSVISLCIAGLMIVVALFSNFIASDLPLIMSRNNELILLPNLFNHPGLLREDIFSLRADEKVSWKIEPLIPYGPLQDKVGGLLMVQKRPDFVGWFGLEGDCDAFLRRAEEYCELKDKDDTLCETSLQSKKALKKKREEANRYELIERNLVTCAQRTSADFDSDLQYEEFQASCKTKEKNKAKLWASFNTDSIESLRADTEAQCSAGLAALPPDATPSHLLGTDDRGRDVFVRMVHGARISLSVGFVAVSIYVFIGIILGAAAGYFGGWVEIIVSRMNEILLSFPPLVLLLAIMGTKTNVSIYLIMVAIGLTGWTTISRLTRAEVLKLKTMDFVTAARALGVPAWQIIVKHILPNSIGSVLVAATFGIASAILIETSLAFLGFGVQPPTPSWGEIILQARQNPSIWWLSLFPGLAIFTAVTAYNLIGEGLRDAIDPKLKRE
jgi:ABC-type dipeptide/oligopeptide/nickel transport system permease subunit